MFQPRVKLEFIRRYLPPSRGWNVYADVDPSERGLTGGNKISEQAQANRLLMQREAKQSIAAMERLGIQVCGGCSGWLAEHGFPAVKGDRDIVAFHPDARHCVVAEVEGASSGQPEQKLYKAIGQLVIAVGEIELKDWTVEFVLVTHGEKISRHLQRASALHQLGIHALDLLHARNADHWVFGRPSFLTLSRPSR